MATARTVTVLLVALSLLATVYTACAAECGQQANDAVCLFGACCSEDGMCGRSDEFCGHGCQEAAGHCNNNNNNNKHVEKSNEDAECGRQAFDAACLFGACCSEDGFCGRGDKFCGNGCQEGAGRCDQ